MKEYKIEDGSKVDTKRLEAGFMDEKSFRSAYQGLVISCHDVFVEYCGGILLVKRLNFPAKDILWPLGGRIIRGVSVEDSLRGKALEEASLELSDLTYLGCARTYFRTDPFGHGKGTDTINLVYFARGEGQLSLNEMHTEPTIFLPRDYQSKRDGLHPYVRDFMNLAIPLVRIKRDGGGVENSGRRSC